MFDLICVGPVFVDLNFTGLPATGPQPGNEIYADNMTLTCGGIGNVAYAGAKLGMKSVLYSQCGTDPLIAVGLNRLQELGVHLELDRHPGMQTSLTTILNYGLDRAMVTYQSIPAQIDPTRFTQAVKKENLRAKATICSLNSLNQAWLSRLKTIGGIIIADIGQDPNRKMTLDDYPQISQCDVFTPNWSEAKQLTGKTTVREALEKLCEMVPTAVVTLGADGAGGMGPDGKLVVVSNPPIKAHSFTGAGEVFNAGLAMGLLEPGWGLEEAIRFACGAATIMVANPHGILGCPTKTQVLRWLDNQTPS